jgi:branched-subunit amino acid ABC-type transport system permease component
MQEILALVSPEKIMALPWHIQIPGVALIVVLAISAIWSMLSLRPVRAFSHLVTAIAVAIILAQGGEAIARLVDRTLNGPVN